MKVILTFLFLFFSAHTVSAAPYPNSYIQVTGFGWDVTYPGGIAGGAMGCGDSSCSGGQYTTYSYINQNSDGSIPENDEDYFYREAVPPYEDPLPFYEGVLRSFVAGDDYIALQDFDFTVTYESFGLEELEFFAGGFFDLSDPSGLFSGSAIAGESFGIGMLGLLSDIVYANEAFLAFEIIFMPKSISEVPLPASIFFLTPALLGFMGLRRKSKLF